jgi:hypothetical protein
LISCSEDDFKKRDEAATKKKEGAKSKTSTPKAISTSKDQKITSFAVPASKWKYDDPRLVQIDLNILRWMCLNCKPLSEVDKPGFAEMFAYEKR